MTLNITSNIGGYSDNILISDIRLPNYSIRNDLPDTNSLKESIIECGLLQPIILRPISNGYEVVAGNRRLEACKQLNWEKNSFHNYWIKW